MQGKDRAGRHCKEAHNQMSWDMRFPEKQAGDGRTGRHSRPRSGCCRPEWWWWRESGVAGSHARLGSTVLKVWRCGRAPTPGWGRCRTKPRHRTAVPAREGTGRSRSRSCWRRRRGLLAMWDRQLARDPSAPWARGRGRECEREPGGGGRMQRFRSGGAGVSRSNPIGQTPV